MCSQADSSRLPHPRFGYSETQGAHDCFKVPVLLSGHPQFLTGVVYRLPVARRHAVMSNRPQLCTHMLVLPLRRPCHRSTSVNSPRPREPLVLEWKAESLGILLVSDSCLSPAGSGPSAPCAEENLPAWSELPGRCTVEQTLHLERKGTDGNCCVGVLIMLDEIHM